MKIVLLAEIKYLLFAGLIATLYFPFNNFFVFNFAMPLESVLIMKYLLNLAAASLTLIFIRGFFN